MTFLTACATTFTGEAHYPGGVQACSADCAKDGMAMSAFIYSGEFASSCVCRPVRPPSATSSEPESGGDEGDVAAITAAVEQARRAAAQQAHNSTMH